MAFIAQDAAALGLLTTEAVDPRYAEIDTLPIPELAALMNDADAVVPAAVRAAFGSIVPAIEAAATRVKAGGRLVYVGAGTPGRLGVLDASEVPPTFGVDSDRVLGIIAGGAEAIVSSVEGAEDDSAAGAAAMDENGITSADVVLALASSGRTPFVLGAARRAGELGALTVGLSCNANVPLSAVVQHPIEILVGPEVVSGSTRLKAGTAQKLVLNMFSTIVMVQSGKTYGNLMVDVRTTNAKLYERAMRILRALTDADLTTAERTLNASGNEVKTAVAMLRLGISADEARSRLELADGRLRRVLEAGE